MGRRLQAARFYVVGGDRMSAVGMQGEVSQAGLRAHAEVSGSAAEMVRPLCHAPTFLAGGGPPGCWEEAGVSLHLGSRSQGSDFKGALLALKSRWESVPQFSELCPCLTLPAMGACGSLCVRLWDPCSPGTEEPSVGRVFLACVLPNQT